MPIYEVGSILELLKLVNLNTIPTYKNKKIIGSGQLNKNGYIQIPVLIAGKIENAIIQWGIGNANSDGRKRITLPVTYPNQTLFVTAFERDAKAWFTNSVPWTTVWGASDSETTNSEITICTRGVIKGGIVESGSYAYFFLTIGW
ncbi:gp53-like domain-containing protein [Gilliamella sp. wkB108]|uniref:gp53-like domain-containing protein n=1 Tax=Gilliamella sp. wkB108 TaxID=3120256 RepID=UPI003FA5DFDF